MATVTLVFELRAYIGEGPTKVGNYSIPINITVPNDAKQDTTVSVPTGVNTVVFRTSDAVGGGSEDIPNIALMVVISPVAGMLTWTDDNDANNSSIKLEANVPFILGPSCQTTPYNATFLSRGTGAASNIRKLAFYQTSGSAALVRVVAFD